MRSTLPVNVNISEAHRTNTDRSTTKTRAKINAHLQSNGTNMLLEPPVLIRPGMQYTIAIDKFPNEHYLTSNDFKKDVKIDADTEIKFINDRVIGKRLHGLISMLDFNRI